MPLIGELYSTSLQHSKTRHLATAATGCSGGWSRRSFATTPSCRPRAGTTTSKCRSRLKTKNASASLTSFKDFAKRPLLG